MSGPSPFSNALFVAHCLLIKKKKKNQPQDFSAQPLRPTPGHDLGPRPIRQGCRRSFAAQAATLAAESPGVASATSVPAQPPPSAQGRYPRPMATHARPQRCPLAPRGSQPWPTATREWPQPRSGGGIACGGGADRHGSLVADGQDNMVVRGIDAQCNWRGASGRELAGGAGWVGLRMVPSWFRLTYGAAVARIGRSGLRQGWAQPVQHMVGRGGPRRAGGAAQRRSCCSAGCERGEEERGGREKIEELTCGPTC